MRRAPVTIRRSHLVPAGHQAWVPRRGLILVMPRAQLTPQLLAHELAHITQAERHPWPTAYLTQWLLTGMSYRNMRFEREARAAEHEPFYLSWAADLLAELAW
jgi:hypothetical protein